MTNELDIAWAAGFIDGEGHIYLRNGSDSYAHALYGIRVVNTDEKPIKKLHRMFGGNLYVANKTKYSNRSVKYEWAINCTNCIPVLEKLIPYLCNKQDEAILLLKFAKEFAGIKGLFGRGTILQVYKPLLPAMRISKKMPAELVI